MFKHIIIIAILFILASCSAKQPDANGLPQSADQVTPIVNATDLPSGGDSNMVKVDIEVTTSEILVLESFPTQFNLRLVGSLPTPCHQLTVDVQPADELNQIKVDVYGMVDPEKVCAQVLQPFDSTVSLGSFAPGHYSIWVNGTMVGEIQI